MNWMVYFAGGTRDLQKHVMESPRPVFECAAIERLTPAVGRMEEVATSYERERYAFYPIRTGLGVYVFEEMV